MQSTVRALLSFDMRSAGIVCQLTWCKFGTLASASSAFAAGRNISGKAGESAAAAAAWAMSWTAAAAVAALDDCDAKYASPCGAPRTLDSCSGAGRSAALSLRAASGASSAPAPLSCRMPAPLPVI